MTNNADEENMDSVEEVIAQNKLKAINKINNYEKRYRQLGYTPIFLLIIGIISTFGVSSSPLIEIIEYHMFIVFLMIFAIGLVQNERIDLLKTIMELKYKNSIPF